MTGTTHYANLSTRVHFSDPMENVGVSVVAPHVMTCFEYLIALQAQLELDDRVTLRTNLLLQAIKHIDAALLIR